MISVTGMLRAFDLIQDEMLAEDMRRRAGEYDRNAGRANAGASVVVDDGDGDYRPTAGMLRLLQALRRTAQRVTEGDDLHACRRRGLVGIDGTITEDGRALLSRYEEPHRG